MFQVLCAPRLLQFENAAMLSIGGDASRRLWYDMFAHFLRFILSIVMSFDAISFNFILFFFRLVSCHFNLISYNFI